MAKKVKEDPVDFIDAPVYPAAMYIYGKKVLSYQYVDGYAIVRDVEGTTFKLSIQEFNAAMR